MAPTLITLFGDEVKTVIVTAFFTAVAEAKNAGCNERDSRELLVKLALIRNLNRAISERYPDENYSVHLLDTPNNDGRIRIKVVEGSE